MPPRVEPDESLSRTMIAATGLPDDVPGLDHGATITPQQLEKIQRDSHARTVAGNELSAVEITTSITRLPHITLVAPDKPGDLLPSHGQGSDLKIVRLLGEGGMGKVFLATQHVLRREVAIKTLKSEFSDGSHAAALLLEAVITGSLEHPNIVPVHALGRDDERRPLLVMKKIDGDSWETLLAQPEHAGWQPLVKRFGSRLLANVEIMMAVCDAVHFAHTRGVVHRDIKPDNVMVGSHGEVYLVDWGVATHLETYESELASRGMVIVGTPAYMAPEMIARDMGTLGPHTDVYLLGSTFHRALTGEVRHRGNTLHALLSSALLSRPVEHGSDVPSEMTALCNDAMKRDPAERIASALEFRNRLTACVAHLHSVSLSRTASQTLVQLRAMLHDTEAVDALQVARTGSECRFAFRQALREWKGNPEARLGLQQCLDELFHHELSRRNLDAASAVAAEMPDKLESHDVALQSLAASLESARLEEARLRQGERRLHALERDLDERVSSRQRLISVGSVAALLTGLAANSVRRSLGNNPVTTTEAALTAVILGVVIAVFSVANRKALFATTLNRRFTVWAWSFTAMLLFHRVVAVRFGLSTAAMFGGDFVLVTSQFALAGALVSNVFFAPFVAMLPWMGASWIWPVHAPPLFAVGSATGLISMTIVMFVRESHARRVGK